jgi:hypothetical protein
MAEKDEKEGKDRSIPSMVVGALLTLLIGGSAPWWSGLIAPKPGPPEPPSRGTVSLAYAGDPYGGCNLQVTVRIGDQQVLPQGSFFTMQNVLLGSQPYEVRGNIHCAGVGSCQVSGNGFVEVTAGRTFHFQWQMTAIGVCSAVLT